MAQNFLQLNKNKTDILLIGLQPSASPLDMGLDHLSRFHIKNIRKTLPIYSGP